MMCSASVSVPLLRRLSMMHDLAAELVGVDLRPLHVPDVRRDEHHVRQLQALEPLHQHRPGVQVVDRDVEEPLHLGRVQVDRHDAVGPGALDQVGDQLGRDRRAALVLAVLAGVAEVRDHRRHALGAGPAEAVDPDEQLHQVGVHRVAGRLDDEAVAAADVLVDLHDQLAVGEQLGAAAAQRDLEVVADLLRQLAGWPGR